ncbi:DinB/UmuC family translesion DNA polymerase [Streptomyces sp. NBC_01450]|uniref:DinB/UmuC family translesion DNA polymerase n=1 Tax=Streptomyces sp. NBC_01450 TaxID=2903871 RepID=UPI003FCC575C
MGLAAELGARLRSCEQAARLVTVVVRMADRTDLSKARTLGAPSGHTDDLRRAVYGVLDGFGLQRARTRRLTLVAEPVDGGRAHTQLTLVPRQATFAPSRRPARTLAAPAESPSTSSTRTSGRHAESTHRTPLLDGQTLPAAALDGAREARLRVEPVIDRLNDRYVPGTVGPAAALAG